MAAVAAEVEDRDWPNKRLLDWGRWARCAVPGDGSSAEGYLRERLDHAHDTGATAEIAETDRAVARVKVSRKDYWKVLARYYMTDLSEYEISLEIGHNIDRVSAMLRQAKMLVAHHIGLLQRASESVES